MCGPIHFALNILWCITGYRIASLKFYLDVGIVVVNIYSVVLITKTILHLSTIRHYEIVYILTLINFHKELCRTNYIVTSVLKYIENY
jgi:hypothetical protein